MKRIREFGHLLPDRFLQMVVIGAATAFFVTGLATGSAWALQDDDDEERRRNWDPAEMLQRLDRDGNGVLDVNEMGGRSGRFIERMGFDPSKPIAVDNLRRKIEQDRAEEERVARREAIDGSRKVPKFGEPAELPDVPRFGLVPGSPLAASSAAQVQYSEEVMESVTRILERFDEDGDGFLAGDETRRIGRFLGGDGEADADQDGRLSQTELAGAYQRMVEEREQRGEEGWRGRRGGRDNDGDDNIDEGNERRPRGSFRRGGDNERGDGERGEDERRWANNERRGNSREAAAPSARQGDANRSAPPARSMDSRVNEYVDGLFRKYDTDGDGQLSAEERTTLKVPFKDSDGDGSISRDEATAHVSGAQQGGGSVSPAARGNAFASRRSSDSDESGGTSDGAGDVRRDVIWSGRTPVPQPARPGDGERPDDFGGRDRNGDGQLQFAEYVDDDELTEEIYEAFLEADRNGDGVLTPDEYDG